jgi:hypothetical protein
MTGTGIGKHMDNKNIVLLTEFVSYCQGHPNERFWQALLNWSGFKFLVKAEELDLNTGEFKKTKDTFYFKEKNK